MRYVSGLADMSLARHKGVGVGGVGERGGGFRGAVYVPTHARLVCSAYTDQHGTRTNKTFRFSCNGGGRTGTNVMSC